MVRLPQNEFEGLLEQAACRGARKALQQAGLADETAANDIRTLRDLAGSLNYYRLKPVGWITLAKRIKRFKALHRKISNVTDPS